MPLDLSNLSAIDLSAGPLPAFRALCAAGELRADARQSAVAERLQALFEALDGYRPRNGRRRAAGAAPRGVYLHGGVGRGKTMLMDLMFDGLADAGKRRVHFHAFMQELHDTLHSWRSAGEKMDDPVGRFAGAVAAENRVLCFDEFHVDNIADAMILGKLFEALFTHGVVIVATSNSAPDELYRDGLQRDRFLPFIELICDRLDVTPVDGPVDYRRERLRDMTLYHAPLGAVASAALDAAFAELSDGADGAPCTLKVRRRKLRIPRAACGVADVPFAELCEKPLGAADYLVLAGAFHTLILRDVPLLPRERRNEARRLVTLIDVLYENKVGLVVSAAGPPDALYPEGHGADTFQRAVSRLLEMQSAGYLAQTQVRNTR